MQRVLSEARTNFILMLGLGILFFTLIVIEGCSQGGGGPTILRPEGTYKTGFFIDSTVEGLQYRCITWSGTTDSQGRFFYNDGEEITFSVGGVVLGRTSAKGIITPVDLDNTAQPNFSTEAVNISRFLLSLDEDLTPDNGIKIPQSVTDSLKGISVDFSNPDLDNDAGVKEMFEILNGSGIYPEEEARGLVPYETAELHLEKSLNQLAEAEAEAEDALSRLELRASIVPPSSSIIMIENQSLDLQGSVNGGKAPYTYTWNINNEKPFSTRLSPGIYTFKSKGSYILAFTAVDSLGATNSDIRHISVFGPETQEGQTEADSIPSVSIIGQPLGGVIKAGSTVDFQAVIYNGNLPLYYAWSFHPASGNTYSPRDETVMCIPPRTYMATQSITLNVPGSNEVSLAIKDTSVSGKTPDTHASRTTITVE